MSQVYRVNVENNYSQTKRSMIVYCEDHETAILAAGVSPEEFAEVAPISPWDLGLQGLSLRRLPKAKEMAMFYEGVVDCLSIGTGLVDSLGIISQQQPSPYFRGVIGQLISDLRRGISISDAFVKHNRIFPPATVAVIKAGETSGDLVGVFRSLAFSEARSGKIFDKVKASLTYPAIVLVMTMFLVYYITTKVVPMVSKQYASFNAELPKITLFVVKISDIMQSRYFLPPVILVLWLLYAKRRLILDSDWFQRMLLATPILGNMLRKMILARIFRALSMLLTGGVRIARAFEIASMVAESREYQTSLQGVGQRLVSGDELHIAFTRFQTIFGKDSTRVIAFLRLASHTGNAAPILEKLASGFEDEVERQADILQQLLEPLMMAGLSLMVGGVIFAAYYPIFNLGQVVLKNK
jgi:type IV pilus assembly protein PilC